MTFEYYALDGWTCMSKLFSNAFAIFRLLTTVTIVHHIGMTENVPLTIIDRSIFTQLSLNSLIWVDQMSNSHHKKKILDR